MKHFLKNSLCRFGCVLAAILCVSPIPAATMTPEFLAFKVNDDFIIRDNPNWEYLGGANLVQTTALPEFVNVGGRVTFCRQGGMDWPDWIAGYPSVPAFTWSGSPDFSTHNGNSLSYGTITNPGGPTGGAAINDVYRGFYWQNSGGVGATGTLTVSGLEVGEYYTLQIFSDVWTNSNNLWRTEFNFNTTGIAGSKDNFRYTPVRGIGSKSSPAGPLYVDQERPAETFAGLAGPVCYEYVFQAGDTSMTMDMTKIQITSVNHGFHIRAVALAHHPDAELLTQALAGKDYGTLSADNGKLQLSAYSTQHDYLLPATTWKLEVADSYTGARTVLASGSGNLGDATTTVSLLNLLGPIDPSFELSGTYRDMPGVSPWTSIGGASGNAFIRFSEFENFLASNGAWRANPAKNDWGSRDGTHPTAILRSAKFTLTGDAITFDQLGGIGNIYDLTGLTEDDLRTTTSNDGFMGVALRDADTGEYLLTKQRPGGARGNGGNNWVSLEFTAEEIAAIMAAGVTEVTLDIIDEYNGNWGFINVDNFQMIGELSYFENLHYFLTVGDTPDVAYLGSGPGTMDNSGVPEPATWVLMLLGSAAGLWVYRKKQS